MSFTIKNTGRRAFKQIEIIVPFCEEHISDTKSNMETSKKYTSINKRCSKLLLTMQNPLNANKTCFVEYGFKVTFLKRPLEMYLHFFNLNPIGEKNTPTNPPTLCVKTMKLYMILPKSYERIGSSVPSNHCIIESISDSNKGISDSNISKLISDISKFFEDDKNKSFKRIHSVFEWDKKKLSDLEDMIVPATKKRLIQFEFRKKKSIHIPIVEYDLPPGELSIVLSVIGIVLSVIGIII